MKIRPPASALSAVPSVSRPGRSVFTPAPGACTWKIIATTGRWRAHRPGIFAVGHRPHPDLGCDERAQLRARRVPHDRHVLSYWLYTLAGVDPLFSIPINAVALFLLGMFIYRFIISKVTTGPPLAQLVVTFGVSIFLANFAALIWTPNYPLHRAYALSGTWEISGINSASPRWSAP